MGVIYFFDRYFKRYLLKGTKALNPSDTGIFPNGISCIREADVNMWFYTKDGNTIAFDSGHMNFPDVNFEFEKININPDNIKYVFLTHVDVDHAGGIDQNGKNIFPNAQVYIGEKDEQYLTGQLHRMKKLGFLKLNIGVSLSSGYKLIKDGDVFNIEGIKIVAIHIPGHTIGHMCYIVDDKILISGDCLAINKKGGYPFFDFFTQFPEMNKKSLIKLKEKVKGYNIEAVCTGHSGYREFDNNTFAHITETADFGRKNHFDEDAPDDCMKY